MARLICRWPSRAVPTAEQAEAAGIGAWLVQVHLPMNNPEQGELVVAAEWQTLQACGLPFALEWRLGECPSTEQLQQMAELLQPWLREPLYLRWRQQSPLWIFDPEHLPPEAEALQPLQQLLGPHVRLWGGGPQGQTLDGTYIRPLLDLPCQRLSNHQLNYESFLFHAHHGTASTAVHVPAVLACDPARERQFGNAAAGLYNEWLALACSWADLWHGPGEAPWVLVEDWPGHRRWWTAPTSTQPAADPTGRQGLQSSSAPAAAPPAACISWGAMVARHPALLVHAYHLELLEPMLQHLDDGERPALDLYVSAPLGQGEAIAEVLVRLGWQRVLIVEVANRGRDLAPFVLELLPRVLAAGHPWLVKLHTKHSSHLGDGASWGEHLWQSLANPAALVSMAEQFRERPELGLVAAPGTLLPAGISLDRNASQLLPLLQRSALPPHWWLQQPMVAGSMFAARSEALRPLLDLGLNGEAFDAEQGQRDGALAHAIERLVAALVLRQGFRIGTLSGSGDAVPGFGYRWAAPSARERLELIAGEDARRQAKATTSGGRRPLSAEIDWCVLIGPGSPEMLEVVLASGVPLLVVCANPGSSPWLQALQSQLLPHQLGVCTAVPGAGADERRWYRYNDPRHDGLRPPGDLQTLYPNLQLVASEPLRQLPLSAILEQWPWAEGNRGWLVVESQPSRHNTVESLLQGTGAWLQRFAAVWMAGGPSIPAEERGPSAEPPAWHRWLEQACLYPEADGRWQRDQRIWLEQRVRDRALQHEGLTDELTALQSSLASITAERDALAISQQHVLKDRDSLAQHVQELTEKRNHLQGQTTELRAELAKQSQALTWVFPYTIYRQIHPDTENLTDPEVVEHYLRNPPTPEESKNLRFSTTQKQIDELKHRIHSLETGKPPPPQESCQTT